MVMLLYAAWLSVVIALVRTTCPHDDLSLVKWSDNSTWLSSGAAVPSQDSAVSIKSSVLLDVNPGFDLESITVESGGRLVFSPAVDIALRLRHMIVRGRVDIGSEDCLYTGKATITLLGLEDDNFQEITGFGKKFIGVESGGILEIHGQRKTPWTKLSSTLSKIPSEAVIFHDKVTKEDDIAGLMVYSLNPTTGQPDAPLRNFNIRTKMQKQTDRQIDQFISFTDSIPDGNIVAIAVRKSIVDEKGKLNISKLYDAVEVLGFGSVTGESKIRELVFYDGYSMILVKGDPSVTQEEFSAYKAGGVKQTSRASMIKDDMKIEVTSFTSSRGFGRSFVEFLITDPAYSLPIVDVIDDVSSWNEGDEVVIASTDYDWTQHEYGTIIACDTCSAKQIRLDLTPAFTHYGEVYHRVDMRAEIAVLTRNVVIQGDMLNGDDENGGHIKVLKGFNRVRVQNAELAHLGQSQKAGMYPMHWHMCETPTNPTYIRGCSIHHTYARCVTVHGSNNVEVADNACVESLGHGYFLEEGGERHTVFTGNLGLGQRRGKLIPTDVMTPSTFWITNPETTLRNNVAAGGNGNGYWFAFPKNPFGLSADKGWIPDDTIRKTAITEFNNNVAHSNKRYGLRIDATLGKNGQLEKGKYLPTEEVEILKLTAYKNSMKNSWIRGNNIKINQASLSDSPEGINMFKGDNRDVSGVYNSVILGDSANAGEPVVDGNGTVISDRSVPIINFGLTQPRFGMVVYAGPIFADSVWFSDFRSTEHYNAGAIGFSTPMAGFTSPANSISNAQFGFNDPEEGNRVFSPQKANHYFTDVDGGVTTISNSRVIKPLPFHLTENCFVRSNWGMAICDETFGQIKTWYAGSGSNRNTMFRLDDPTANVTRMLNGGSRFNVVLGGTIHYGMLWETVPKAFVIRGARVDKDHPVVVGVCVPRDASLKLKIFGYGRQQEKLASLSDLAASTEPGKYVVDSDVGMLFVKLTTDASGSANDTRECTNGQCPSFQVKVGSSNYADSDCVQRYTDKYLSTNERSLLNKLHLAERSINIGDVMTMTSSEPPMNFGAGATK